MSLVPQEIVLYADSQFGSNLSAGGNQFTQSFSPPLRIPADALGTQIECVSASVWYMSTNLAAGTFSFDVSTNGGSSYTTYTYDFSAGLYDLAGVIQMFNLAASENDLNSYDYSLFGYEEITSTQRVSLGVWLDDTSYRLRIDWDATTGNSNIASLLGFDTSATDTWGDGTNSQTYQYEIAANEATFSALSYYQLQSTLGGSVFDPSGQSSPTLAVIIPDVSVGSQIRYEPYHPLRSNAAHLAGSSINAVTYTIRDDDNQDVTFLDSASWSLQVRISYFIRV